MRARTFALLTACALSACNSQSPTATGNDAERSANLAAAAPATAAKDPCSLLTAAEVSAIVGDKIVSAKADNGTCTYATDDNDAVELELDQSDARGKVKLDRETASVLSGMGHAVAGQGGAGADTNSMLSQNQDAALGDEALVGPNQRLSVRKGDTYLAITPPAMHSRISYAGNPLISSEDKRKMALALAQKALSKLP